MIGERLKNLREKKNLTKKCVAEKFGIHESTYGKYELNRRNPDLEMLQKLANFYNVTVDYFTSEEEPDEEIVILSRAAKEMTHEQRQRLLEMAKIMFKEEFPNDE